MSISLFRNATINSALVTIAGVALGLVHGCTKIAHGAGTDQQRIAESAAIRQVDFDCAFLFAQTYRHLDHLTLRVGDLLDLGVTLFSALLDLGDAHQRVFVNRILGAIDGQAEAYPVFAVALEGLDVLGR